MRPYFHGIQLCIRRHFSAVIYDHIRLYFNDMTVRISVPENTDRIIRHGYKEIANSMGIADYQQLVEGIAYRRQRNSEQHDLIHDYINRRRKYKLKPDFFGFITRTKIKWFTRI